MRKFFKYKGGQLPLPLFFPDATRAVVKSIDTSDIEGTKTPGILVNTFHLWRGLTEGVLEKFGGIAQFMDFNGAIISDSGGFQVMSVIKSGVIKGRITDQGAIYYTSEKKKEILTPEKSIEFQMKLKTDMVVVLDDFTDPKSDYEGAKVSVERTISWAERSKKEFEKICKEQQLDEENRPYLLGVVQGGEFMDLRKVCTKELVRIGFDGLGWGGWPFVNGKLNFESAKVIAENSPEDYFLYGLGVGKPEDIITLAKLGYNIFDCVLPTRDARHGRLYIYNFDSIEEVNINEKNLYSYFNPDRAKFLSDDSRVSDACDCILCTRYSKAYISHLFKIGDFTAGRLATVHNLRFYSILMEKIKLQLDNK